MTKANTRLFAWIVALMATASASEALAKPAFCLPKYLYAAPGLECNVYYRNVLESVAPQNYTVRARGTKGRGDSDRWHWTPTKADAGKETTLILDAWNDDGCQAVATSIVRVASLPKDTSRTFSVALFFGSIVNSHFQDQAYKDVLEAGWTNCIPVGSRKATVKAAADLPLVPHDGFGGYTFSSFLTQYAVSEDEFAHVQDEAERKQLLSIGVPKKIVHDWQRGLLRSPLVQFRNGRKVVDVKHWVNTACGGRPPDLVIIGLGLNGTYGLRGSVQELRAMIPNAVIHGENNAEAFIRALRKEMPNAQFAFCNEPLGCGQDAFGENFGMWLSEMDERNLAFAISHEYERYVETCGDPKISFIPFMHAIDLANGFPTSEVPLNARSTRKVRRQTNAMHPTVDGGRQYGDAVAAWVLWWLGNADKTK